MFGASSVRDVATQPPRVVQQQGEDVGVRSERNPADIQLEDAARQALAASGHLAVARIDVSAREGAVVLRGEVSRHYLKQVAQTVVLPLSDVCSLRNEIAVVPQ